MSPGRPRVPASVLFMTAGASQYAGAALAVTLFTAVAPVSVAWARALVAAVVLLVWRRPWRAAWTRPALLAAVGSGLVLTVMNVLLYVAIARVPLAAAVSVQFAGPVVLAAVRVRSLRTGAGVAAAGLGLLCLGGLGAAWGTDPTATAVGLLAAGGAGAAWVAYLVLGARAVGHRDQLGSLGVGTAAGALALTPLAAPGAVPLLADGRLLLTAVGVGLLSSAVPTALDRRALPRLGTAMFALLSSLLPVTAAVVGRVALGQRLSAWEIVGLALMSWAVLLTTTPLRRRAVHR